MPALNFQTQFAPKIVAKKKRRTIRAHRIDGKPHARAGDQLHLYTGMRTPAAVLLMPPQTCIRCDHITIDFRGAVVAIARMVQLTMRSPQALWDSFAQDDGFEDWAAMSKWFGENHPGEVFDGEIIEWTDEPSDSLRAIGVARELTPHAAIALRGFAFPDEAQPPIRKGSATRAIHSLRTSKMLTKHATPKVTPWGALVAKALKENQS